LRDPYVDAALAQLSFDLHRGDALVYAESALSYPDLGGQSRCDALLVYAQEQALLQNHEKAKSALVELTQLRRHPIDRLYLAGSLLALGDDAASKQALADATRINPRLWNVHQLLAKYYREHGDAERAAWHQQRAVP
jgi:predicted Zn-dependent protease